MPTKKRSKLNKIGITLENWKPLLAIAWPLVIANSFWNLQLTIDRIFLGHHSTGSLAASIAVNGVFWAPMALLQQTSAYLMTFVAQYLGAKENHNVGASLWQSIYVTVAGGLLFLCLIPASGKIFSWIGHSSKLQDLETAYFATLCLSAMPMALVAASSAFLTGLGLTKKIIYVNAVGLIANVILDYIFIFGALGLEPMGIRGAGYATALSAFVSFGVCAVFVFEKKNEKLYAVRSKWHFHKKLFLRYLRFGVPSGMQWALEGLAFTIFLVFVGRMENGEAALAASGIAVSLLLLAILPSLGLAQGVSVLVGQSLGAGDWRDAVNTNKAGLQISLIYTFFVAVFLIFGADIIIALFKNSEGQTSWSQVEVLAPELLLFVVVLMFCDSFNLIYSFSLKGAGDTWFVSMVALIIPWPFMVLPTWWFHQSEGAIYWAWGAVVIYVGIQAAVLVLRFKQGAWKTMSVIRE